jgi:hypothetical protein
MLLVSAGAIFAPARAGVLASGIDKWYAARKDQSRGDHFSSSGVSRQLASEQPNFLSSTMNRGMRSTIEHEFIQVRRRRFCSLASKTFN